jgi:hypothetical protein
VVVANGIANQISAKSIQHYHSGVAAVCLVGAARSKTVQGEQVEKTQMHTALELNGRNCPSRKEQSGNDLRGMPADLSKFYPATPTYEWLNSSSENSARAVA